MKIGFDAKRALNNGTGLGNHARILLNALMRDFPDHKYALYAASAEAKYLDDLQGEFDLCFPEKKISQYLPAWWRSYGISEQLVKNRIDVYHGLSNELPFNIHRSGIPAIVTIHDLIFLKHKEQYPRVDRQIYTKKTKYAAKYADRIIAVSEETKRELMEMYHVPERKITVIYPSVDARFYNKAIDESKTAVAIKYKLPIKYILNVGSFFPRKNQMRLIAAFDLIKNAIEEDLVLVGGTGTMLDTVKKEIVSRGLQDRVHILTSASNGDLPAIYQKASIFAFPSLFEGFGAPVLEALFSAVPVIATRGGAIAEAAGIGSLFIDPGIEEDIAEKMLSVLNNATIRNAMIAQGLLHAQTMTDQIFAAKTMDIYTALSRQR